MYPSQVRRFQHKDSPCSLFSLLSYPPPQTPPLFLLIPPPTSQELLWKPHWIPSPPHSIFMFKWRVDPQPRVTPPSLFSLSGDPFFSIEHLHTLNGCRRVSITRYHPVHSHPPSILLNYHPSAYFSFGAPPAPKKGSSLYLPNCEGLVWGFTFRLESAARSFFLLFSNSPFPSDSHHSSRRVQRCTRSTSRSHLSYARVSL